MGKTKSKKDKVKDVVYVVSYTTNNKDYYTTCAFCFFPTSDEVIKAIKEVNGLEKKTVKVYKDKVNEENVSVEELVKEINNKTDDFEVKIIKSFY